MESRQGRDAVVQHALLPSHSPLAKTPHNAGVIRVALMAAVVALLQMATKNSSPADLDRSHDATLRHSAGDNLCHSSGIYPLLRIAGDPFSAVRSTNTGLVLD